MNDATDTLRVSTKLTELNIRQAQHILELRTEGDALQSAINLQYPHRLALKNLEYLAGILLFRPDPVNILVLGTGGGSLIHFLRYHYPQTHIISVEIDGEMLEFMHQNMHLPRAGNGLTYIIDDAAHYIRYCRQRFDLILVDIFTGNRSPRWLFERDCIRSLQNLLSTEGGISYNLLIESDHEFKLFYQNLRLVFEQKTACLALQAFDNTIAYGLNFDPPREQMSEQMQKAIDLGARHGMDYLDILSAIYATNPVGSGII